MKILHVDNSIFFIKMLKGIFENMNSEYIGVKSIIEAEKILKEGNIDILITAKKIKDEKVEKLLEFISNEKYDIPIFLISSDLKYSEKLKYFNMGILNYIPKEITYEELLIYTQNMIKYDVLGCV